MVTSLFVKRTVRRQDFGSRWFQTIVTVGGYLLIFCISVRLGPLDRRIFPETSPTDYVGVALTLIGVLFAIWARVHLGGNWSGSVTVKKDHTLIRSGPYRIVRHPIYTGLLVGAVGGVITVGTIRGFLGVVLLVVVFRIKSLLEERFMQGQFGSQYLSYKRDVKALVPFIW